MFSQSKLTGCEFKAVFTETETFPSNKLCSALTLVLISSVADHVYIMIIIQPTKL